MPAPGRPVPVADGPGNSCWAIEHPLAFENLAQELGGRRGYAVVKNMGCPNWTTYGVARHGIGRFPSRRSALRRVFINVAPVELRPAPPKSAIRH